jgi:hypothetical protein
MQGTYPGRADAPAALVMAVLFLTFGVPKSEVFATHWKATSLNGQRNIKTIGPQQPRTSTHHLHRVGTLWPGGSRREKSQYISRSEPRDIYLAAVANVLLVILASVLSLVSFSTTARRLAFAFRTCAQLAP